MKTLVQSIAANVLLCVALQPVSAQQEVTTNLPVSRIISAIQADGLDIPEQRLELSNQNGWLVVTLTADPDELEWKIVLAKLEPDTKPRLTIHPRLPLFSVQYGPWFIRESLGRLRVYREPKEFESDEWKQIGDAPKGKTPCTAGRLFVVVKDEWCWVCTSPKCDKMSIDTQIRFQHASLKKGHGSLMFADGQLAEVFCGEARCHDEGDLLVASRVTGYGARAMVRAAEIENTLVGKPMPTISGRAVGTSRLPAKGDLEGKVVLVDFWATWCAPCVEKLPVVDALQSKYRDRGLVVIGVHANQKSDGLEEFLTKQPVQFPIALDDGETEKLFGVTRYPTYYLIGRDGTVKYGFQTTPPTEAQIESELEADEQNDAPERRSRAK